MFGADLDIEPAAISSVAAALLWLEKHHLTTEGLWFVKTIDNLAALRVQTDLEGQFPLHSINDPHELVSLLCEFLKQVPGALVDPQTGRNIIDTWSYCVNGYRFFPAEVLSGTTEDTTPPLPTELTESEAAVQVFKLMRAKVSLHKRRLLARFLAHWHQAAVVTDNALRPADLAMFVYLSVFCGDAELWSTGLVGEGLLVGILKHLILAPVKVISTGPTTGY